jgi:hypothetical protein
MLFLKAGFSKEVGGGKLKKDNRTNFGNVNQGRIRIGIKNHYLKNDAFDEKKRRYFRLFISGRSG